VNAGADYQASAHRRAFGKRLKQLRSEHGWTQEQLAEHAGVHRSYLASLETGARNPTLDLMVKLAEGLGVDPADLLKR
jgi:transcriptional regulator with XRE-family HTH domain